MLAHDDNERVTRVGPGTPMGTTMRRYWMPALLAWELPEPDCPPVRVKLLGEELVAFRDTPGQDRPARGALPAPAGVALLRPQRGLRPALRVPRLEVRRRRPVRGHDERARGAQLRRQDPHHGLSHGGGGRRDLGLPGPGGAAAAAAEVRVDAGAADASARLEGHPGEQLAAGPRGRHRHLARPHPPPGAERRLRATRIQARRPLRARQGADPRARRDRLRLSRTRDCGPSTRTACTCGPITSSCRSTRSVPVAPAPATTPAWPVTSGCRWMTRPPWSTTGSTAPPSP